MPVSRLPDEMVLEVLQHLDMNSRLRCRLVSRHLNDVVLKSLTSLTVNVERIKDGVRAVAPLRKLFRGASRLKRIELHYFFSDARMLNLVKYLAGHPSLTRLRVYASSNLSKLCSNVAAVLRELPALEELDLDMAGYIPGGPHPPSLSSRQELMQAIRPHSTPHLSRLLVIFTAPQIMATKDDDQCLHNWLHSESVQEMLAANRGLRLTVTNYNRCAQGQVIGCCKFCLLGCHNSPFDSSWSARGESRLKSYEFSYLSFRDSNSSA